MDCEGMELCLTLSGSGALALVREMAELLDADSRVEITDLVVDLLRRRRLERGGAQPVSPGLGQAIHDECQQPTAATPLPALAAASSGTSPTAQPVSPELRLAIDQESTSTLLAALADGVSTMRVARAHQMGTQWMAFIEGSGPRPGLSPPFPGDELLSTTVHVVLRGGGRDKYDGTTLHRHKFSQVMLYQEEQCVSIGYMDRTRALTSDNNMDANAVFHGFPSMWEVFGFLAGAGLGGTTCTDLRRLPLPRQGLPQVSFAD